jgi:Ca2+-transporting ATPase
MFGARTLTISGLQGASAFAVVMGVYLWAVSSGRPDDAVRSIAFATLVVGNLALILVNRSWRLSMGQTLRARRNRTLKWILAASGIVLVLVLGVPWLRDAFKFGPMRAVDWLVAIVAGIAGVAWFEVYKRLSAAASTPSRRSPRS